MRNKQWQTHHKKDQTTANRMTFFFFFFKVGTAVWPRKFYHFVFGKFPVAIPRFLRRENKKEKTLSFHSPWFALSYGAFAIVYSSLATLLWLIHRDSRSLRELTRRRPWKKRGEKQGKTDFQNSNQSRQAVKTQVDSRSHTTSSFKSHNSCVRFTFNSSRLTQFCTAAAAEADGKVKTRPQILYRRIVWAYSSALPSELH